MGVKGGAFMEKKMDQLCERCSNACGGCEWSASLQPVPGWKTKPGVVSVEILSCPKFSQGNRDDKRIRGFTYAGVLNLFEAFLKQLRKDYVCGSPEGRIQIEEFLRSKKCKEMLQFTDPEAVIRGLRKLIHVGRRLY